MLAAVLVSCRKRSEPGPLTPPLKRHPRIRIVTLVSSHINQILGSWGGGPVHTYIYICIHRGKEREDIMKGGGVPELGVSIYIYMYIYAVYAYRIHISKHMQYVYIYVYMYICMYVYMYVCSKHYPLCWNKIHDLGTSEVRGQWLGLRSCLTIRRPFQVWAGPGSSNAVLL